MKWPFQGYRKFEFFAGLATCVALVLAVTIPIFGSTWRVVWTSVGGSIAVIVLCVILTCVYAARSATARVSLNLSDSEIKEAIEFTAVACDVGTAMAYCKEYVVVAAYSIQVNSAEAFSKVVDGFAVRLERFVSNAKEEIEFSMESTEELVTLLDQVSLDIVFTLGNHQATTILTKSNANASDWLTIKQDLERCRLGIRGIVNSRFFSIRKQYRKSKEVSERVVTKAIHGAAEDIENLYQNQFKPIQKKIADTVAVAQTRLKKVANEK
jgi:hypothetical protein